jgi:hypothetical protein
MSTKRFRVAFSFAGEKGRLRLRTSKKGLYFKQIELEAGLNPAITTGFRLALPRTVIRGLAGMTTNFCCEFRRQHTSLVAHLFFK